MTAIAGYSGAQKQGREKIQRMLAALAHRGRDSEQIMVASHAGLGARSAALSEARGQGIAQDGQVSLVLDGDLFNPREDGVDDAQFALQQYQRHGRGFARYLDGVFACALCDGEELLLVRDPLGVRPLYYGRDQDGELFFASEMKALIGTVVEIEELLPATVCSSATGVFSYLPELPEIHVAGDFSGLRDQLRKTLFEAVARRMADGAVGACLLSGGLDSSIIAAIVHDMGVDMPLLTVGVEGASDIENAKVVAAHLGMEHHVHQFDRNDITELVPTAVRALESFDEDCVSGAVSNLIASAFAAGWTNCILSGEGGDELFGGYHLLKEIEGEGGRLRMMEKLVAIAYNTALQRLDRSMMGNGIHYRTPFLDSAVVALAHQTPVGWKIYQGQDGNFIEKYILREAFRDLLPEVIYRRVKLRFAAGAGTDGMMDRIAADQLAPSELEKHPRSQTGYQLHSLKELWYYRLFQENFPHPSFERMVGRWDPFK